MISSGRSLRAIVSTLLLGSIPVSASVLASATEATKAIPFKTVPANAAGDPLQLIAGFAICVLVLVVIIYVLRRRLASTRLLTGEKKQIRIAESQRLGARSTLHVVEFAGKRYLLAQTEQNVSCIAAEQINEALQEKQP